MNPAGSIAEGRERDAPADRRELVRELRYLADDLLDAACTWSGSLDAPELEELCDLMLVARRLATALDEAPIEAAVAQWRDATRRRLRAIQRRRSAEHPEELALRRQIAHVWSVEDVQSVRPDLDAEQAWSVLQLVDDQKDATLGISWETIEAAAESIYPTEGGAS